MNIAKCMLSILMISSVVACGNQNRNNGVSTAGDTIPPLVSATTPTNNAANIAVNATISVTFSEAMDHTTINKATIIVNGSAGSVTFDNDRTATFTPSANLDYNRVYTVTITTGVKDLAGHAMATDYTWSFSTVPLKLPDTGQTTSYASTFGEDHDYIINPPSYMDNGNGTITDNVTGLVWQKEDDNSIRTWDMASAYCDNLTLGGYTDWRMPTINELMGIEDYSGSWGAAIDLTFFPHTIHWSMSQYWSATAFANNAGNAWDVVFDDSIPGAAPDGSVYGASKASTYYIRCVRGGQYPLLNYTDNGDGTITENNTLLMWQKDDDNTTRTWEQALGYCEGLTLAGYTDWRLPNIKELHYLVDSTTYNPAIDTAVFPSSKAAPYWSSTTIASASTFAWFVDFYNGYAGDPYLDKTGNYYVRCVRSGQ